MRIKADSLEIYISQLSEERQPVMEKLVEVINKNLPKGFHQTMQYQMITWVVPLETYPDGYHCTPDTPLPFLSLASQKNFIALYHMGLYADESLLNWFVEEYPKYAKRKLDMGKSCIRFKKMDDIPYELMAALMKKIRVEDWIACYEKNYKK